MPEPRDEEQLLYPKQTILWAALLIFLLGLRSRRQYRFESDSQPFVDNLNRITHANVEQAPHDDTIAYYLERVKPEQIARLPSFLVHQLIRNKVLDDARLYGRFLIAVDGTGQLVYHQRHCDHCLTRKSRNGKTLYFHPVLEAKLVTPSGLALSVATEFITNADPNATKQDCERKAFTRLAAKLKTRFPRLGIVILADALYACAPVFQLCEEHHWDFIITCKAGSLPALVHDYTSLKKILPKNRTQQTVGTTRQHFAWVNDLQHEKHRLSVFECRETTPEKEQYFAWVTSFHVECASVITLANQGGRLRWKIENEGFNIQKNHGYALEHAYSKHEYAAQNFYYLLQVAHTIHQLMQKGSLLRDFRKRLGSFRNFLRRLAEDLRNQLIPLPEAQGENARSFQIRLDDT